MSVLVRVHVVASVVRQSRGENATLDGLIKGYLKLEREGGSVDDSGM